jgi:hypothetical protein
MSSNNINQTNQNQIIYNLKVSGGILRKKWLTEIII